MATRDLTTATKIDPNGRFNPITADQITITGLTRNESAYMYWDDGVDNYGYTFTHSGKFNVSSASDTSGAWETWSVSNVIADSDYWLDNSSEAISLSIYRLAGSDLRVGLREWSTDTYDLYILLAYDTDYWYIVKRTSSTAIEAYVYSDATFDTEVCTLSITIPAHKYRYMFPINSFNTGNSADISGTCGAVDLAHPTYTVSVEGSSIGTDNYTAAMEVAAEATAIGSDAFRAGTYLVDISDTSAGSDDNTVALTVSMADTSAGSDGNTVTLSVAISDTSAGSDDNTVALTADVAESTEGQDGNTVALTVSMADTIEGSDEYRALLRLVLDCAKVVAASRILTFPSGGEEAWLLADAELVLATVDETATVDAYLLARRDLSAIVPVGALTIADVQEMWPDALALNHAELVWDEVTTTSRILLRKDGAGSFVEIAQPSYYDLSYTDGPLADNDYDWRLDTYDDAGNVGESNVFEATVAVGPAPPTALSLSHNDGSGLTALSWTASADATGYNLYTSPVDGPVRLTGTPTDLGNVVTTGIDNSATTGEMTYLVRAYNAAGVEEASISQMVKIDLSGGVQILTPNSPSIISGTAIAGGQVRVVASYVGEGADGVAATMRVYSNDGAGGAVSYVTPVATGALRATAAYQSATLDTAGLDGQKTYILVARARTAVGVEDTNTVEIEVLTDSVSPTAVTLTGTLQ